MVSIICAIGKNYAIGKGQALLWKLPGDLKRFKSTTMGHPMIMGRKTYESIGRPLPGRTTIILTRNAGYLAQGCIVVQSMEEALREAHKSLGSDEVFIAGGGEIYAQAISFADRLILTLVDDLSEDADTFFPSFGGFELNSLSDKVCENGINYRFAEFVRTNNKSSV